jgi:energy-coupling factor transporter transmembrane protein EcfT
VEFLVSRLRELPGYVPGLRDLIENLPFLILFLWIGFLFFILVYFRGGIKDLEEKMGKGSITHLQIFLWAAAAISFVSMVSLAFYLILRTQ